MHEIVPGSIACGFIACAIAIVLGSLLSPAPDKNIVEKFEQADQEYRNLA